MPTPALPPRLEAAAARGLLNLPAPMLRLLAGTPIVRDGQTLDVQTQLLLRLQRLQGNAALGGRDPAHERRVMDAQCRLLEPRAVGAIQTRAVRLSGGAGPIDGRLYRPDGAPARAPALVFYHGGGFVIGSLDSHDGICRALAARAGCVVVSAAYRLAPEHPAPAAVEDAVAAFRDIANRADGLSLDPTRLAVGGDSAGGNLATVVAQQTADDDIAPAFQLLFYPAVDFAEDRESVRTFARGFLLEKASMDWFHGHYIPASMDNRDPRVSPIHGRLAGLAPAHIITGGFDPLRDEGEAYAAALAAAGTKATHRRLPSMIHGFLNFAGAVRGADAATTRAAQVLAEALR